MKLNRSKTIFVVACSALLGVGIAYQNCGQIPQETKSSAISPDANTEMMQQALQAAKAKAPIKEQNELGFVEMIDRAGIIVEAQVIDIKYSMSAEKHAIYSFVTFAKKNVLKGIIAESNFELRFLGGQIGEEALLVSGLSQFKKGEEVILFLDSEFNPTKTISPLTGFNQGRFTVKQEGDKTQTIVNATGAKVIGHDQINARLELFADVPLRKNIPTPVKAGIDTLVAETDSSRAKASLTKDQFVQMITGVVKEFGLQGKSFKAMTANDKLKSVRFTAVPAPDAKERGGK